MRRCSSFIWSDQTSFLAPCLGPFGPATQRSDECWGGLRLNTQILVLILVLVAVVSTALGIVYTQHESRRLAVALGSLEARQDEGLAEWSRLQIEQGWLADASQIEKTAREQLQMQQPAETHILVVSP